MSVVSESEVRRKGDSIMTIGGRLFWPLDPRPEEIVIEDIAHHLAIVNRWNGATFFPVSVAQHSVLVSLCCPPEFALRGLLHDASEAYLNDMTRPVKYQDDMAGYRRIEHRLQRVIYERFGLSGDEPLAVKAADDLVLAAEAIQVRPEPLPEHRRWYHERVVPGWLRVQEWSWRVARREFLGRFEELTAA